jgi:hypothetical protein
MQKSRNVKATPNSGPPDYLIIECHCEVEAIKDANPWPFKEALSHAVNIMIDSIISIEFSVGSLVAKALCCFDVNFHRVSNFSNFNGNEYEIVKVHEIKATKDIDAVIQEIGQNSKWLSLSRHDDRVNFLLSEPGIAPEVVIQTNVCDFGMVERVIIEAMEKSLLDLELLGLEYYWE